MGRRIGSKDSYKRFSGNYSGRKKGAKDLKPRATSENRGFDSWRIQNADRLVGYRPDALKTRYLNEVLGLLEPTYRDEKGNPRCNFKVPKIIWMQLCPIYDGHSLGFIEPYNHGRGRPIVRDKFRIWDFMAKHGITSVWEFNEENRQWIKRLMVQLREAERQLEKNKKEEKASQIEQCLNYCI